MTLQLQEQPGICSQMTWKHKEDMSRYLQEQSSEKICYLKL